MRRSVHVTAPLLATAAVAVLSGCHAAPTCPPSSACSDAASETHIGGFGASFNGDTVLWIVAAGAIYVAARIRSGGS
jgi:hypothetical protein